MHTKNRPPVFVPENYQAEIEKLSKAALMDMCWDYAAQLAETDTAESAMTEFRNRREIIQIERQARF